jgi:chaperonin GroEL
MTKHFKNNLELFQDLMKGVNILADNVATTLGPRGRTVAMYHKEQNVPVITKDGVTVADFIELEDPFQNLGVQIIKQAAKQTVETAGDGTTTSTVLARAILKEGQRYLGAGVSPVELKRGIDKAVECIVGRLEAQARPIETVGDILHIATISANNDKAIGTLVSTAIDKAGKDGSVLVEEARSNNTSLDLIEGFRFNSGYSSTSSQFINNVRSASVDHEGVILLVTDEAITTVEQIMPTLEIAARDRRPLLIVSNDIEGQALASLIANVRRPDHANPMKIAAVKAPKYGEERRQILKDLCASTGATFISREEGLTLRDVKLTHFGNATKINMTKAWTTIVGGSGEREGIEDRIEAIKVEIQQTEDLRDCERLQERITRLASGVAVIRVGAATEVEMMEKKHRIDDALEAVRSAQEEGIIPGGGIALIRAVTGLEVETDTEEQQLGVQIVLRACEAPLRTMAENAGESGDIVLQSVRNATGDTGYDFLNRCMVQAYEAGIVDPKKVTRCALENAASAAGTLLTTSHAIVKV